MSDRSPFILGLFIPVLLLASCRSVEAPPTPLQPTERSTRDEAEDATGSLSPETDPTSGDDAAFLPEDRPLSAARPRFDAEPVVISLPVPKIKQPEPVLRLSGIGRTDTARPDTELPAIALPEPRVRRPVADGPVPAGGPELPRAATIALPEPTIPVRDDPGMFRPDRSPGEEAETVDRPETADRPEMETPGAAETDVADPSGTVEPDAIASPATVAPSPAPTVTTETPPARSPAAPEPRPAERTARSDDDRSQAIPSAARTHADRTVQPGQRFTVSLRGAGWIYLGSTGPVEFVGRERRGDEVIFTFRAVMSEDSGTPFDLTFELQDLSTGRRVRHEERIVTLSPEGTTPTGEAIAGRSGDSPRVPERAGGYENDTGGIDTDGVDTAEHPTPERPRSDGTIRDRLTAAAAAEGPAGPEEESLIRELLEGSPYPEEMFALAERFRAAGDRGAAITVLERLLETGAPRYDRVLFNLASLLEKAGSTRDLDRARSLYKQLVEQYPLSDYWERATARVEYLERHFFFIR